MSVPQAVFRSAFRIASNPPRRFAPNWVSVLSHTRRLAMLLLDEVLVVSDFPGFGERWFEWSAVIEIGITISY
jgi:hypothetical protein